MNNTLVDESLDLGVKFEDVAHYAYRNDDKTFCGIPKVELLGYRYPIGGSGKSLCEKCRQLKSNF